MRKPLASLVAVAAILALAACTDTTADEPTSGPSSSTTEPSEEPTLTDEPSDGPTDEPTDTNTSEEPVATATEDDEIETTRFVTEGGRFGFDLPTDYSVESDVREVEGDYWKNGEPSGTYTIMNSAGVGVGSMGVNIETSSDGIPADYIERVDVLPTVLLDDGQVYARVTLSSLCWGESDAPEDECQFIYGMDVVSGGEGDDPEAPPGEPNSLWIMAEDPKDPAQGVVLFNVTVLGPSGKGFPFEEKDVITRSDEYAKAWKMVESFGMNG